MWCWAVRHRIRWLSYLKWDCQRLERRTMIYFVVRCVSVFGGGAAVEWSVGSPPHLQQPQGPWRVKPARSVWHWGGYLQWQDHMQSVIWKSKFNYICPKSFIIDNMLFFFYRLFNYCCFYYFFLFRWMLIIVYCSARVDATLQVDNKSDIETLHV